MANVPTIPGTFQANSPSVGIKADFGALDAPNRANAQSSQNIGRIGVELGDFALKMQAAVNYGIEADADRKMRKTMAEFQQSRQGRTDENQWEAEWKEKSDQLLSSISEESPIGPDLKRKLTENFKDWQTSGAIEVRMMANKQAINRATERAGQAADEAARDGDEQGVNLAIDGAVDHGLLMPEVAAKMKRQYLTKIDEYAAKNFIMANPMSAEDFLGEKTEVGKYVNLPRLTPDQRYSLLQQAKGAVVQKRTDYQNEIATRRFGGELIGDAELEGAVKSRIVTPAWARAFKKQQALDLGKGGSSEDQALAFAEVRSAILAYDPDKDGGAEYSKLFTQAQLLPERMATDAINLLKQKNEKTGPLNTPVARDVFKVIEERFDAGLYGKFKVKQETRNDAGQWTGFYHVATDGREFDAAVHRKMKVLDAARKYLADNPNATAEEANRFVSSVQTTEVVNTGRQALTGYLGIPPAKQTAEQNKARLDAILGKAKK